MSRSAHPWVAEEWRGQETLKKNSYTAPKVEVAGTLHRLTLDANGNGFGKGSLCADGASGLQGNRSFNSAGGCTH